MTGSNSGEEPERIKEIFILSLAVLLLTK